MFLSANKGAKEDCQENFNVAFKSRRVKDWNSFREVRTVSDKIASSAVLKLKKEFNFI